VEVWAGVVCERPTGSQSRASLARSALVWWVRGVIAGKAFFRCGRRANIVIRLMYILVRARLWFPPMSRTWLRKPTVGCQSSPRIQVAN